METLQAMSWFDIAGFIGVGLYIGSYGALQVGLLRGDSYTYALVNGVAAACILLSLAEAFNLSSAIIQVTWISISLVGVIRLYIINSRLRFTEDEQFFLDRAMPGLSKIDARKFLDISHAIDGEEGVQLTQQGEPIKHLIYLVDGEARVFSGGVEVATVGSGNYIGDVTYLMGEPATATVKLATAARYLSFEAENLRKFLERNATVRRQLEESAADNLRKKLTATTQQAASQQMASSSG